MQLGAHARAHVYAHVCMHAHAHVCVRARTCMGIDGIGWSNRGPPTNSVFFNFGEFFGACRRRTPGGEIESEGGVGEASARRVFRYLRNRRRPSAFARRHAPEDCKKKCARALLRSARG